LGRKEESLGHLLSDGASSLDNPSSQEVFEHGPEYPPVIDPLVLKKFCVLCGDESIDQLFRKPVIGDGDPIVHQKLSNHFVFFGIDDGVSIEVSFLQGRKIGQAMGVVEKEQPSDDEEQKDTEDKGVDDIKRPSLFSSRSAKILFFHEE
jgi:hypothetical protein